MVGRFSLVMGTVSAIFVVGLLMMPVRDVRSGEVKQDPFLEKAKKLTQAMIIVDTHIDVPYRLRERWEDISQRTEHGNFDYPRARAGGLNVAFMSIYIPAEYQKKGGAKELADQLIDMVESFEKKWPDKFKVVRSVADVRKAFKEGKIALALGMENGAGIEGDLKNLEHFYRRGIRYITLTHAKWNRISDSSYDEDKHWKGLSPFGEKVVLEMNRLGIMVDVSHISDDAFWDVMRITRAPVIASHSSCRAFTPGWERNMSDKMIKRLAENGGVIQINFGSSFISDAYRKGSEKMRKEAEAYFKDHGLKFSDPEARTYLRQLRQKYHLVYADVKDVADHIDHVVKLVGVDHVGIGSDFDGVGDSLPTGLKDVSMYPNLIAELLRRGYSERDVRKIAGENLLRVWAQVEFIAQQWK